MPYDVFVSHSTKDKIIADAVVAHLEQHGIRCWCAPRDITPGESWASAIVEAIAHCRAVVVVFSKHANESDHIRREVERAVGHGVPIVPLRIEEVMPEGDLEYFLSSSHWMDAITAPVERHFDLLAEKLRVLLKLSEADASVAVPMSASHSTAPSSAQRSDAIVRRGRGNAVRLAAIIAAVIIATVAVVLFITKLNNHQQAAAVRETSRVPVDATVSPKPPSPAPTPSPAPIPSPSPNANPAPVRPTPALPTPGESTPSKDNVNAKPSSPPSPASTPDIQPMSGNLADDARAWQKAALVHWDNAFFFDHARARYADWRRAADAGDPVGEFFVGCCYAQGLGIAEDQAAATQWLTKAANDGSTDAMGMMGERRALGAGISQDGFAAFNWAKRAADAGNIPAMVGVGMALAGQSNAAAQAESHRWLQKAADAGSLDAKVSLIFSAGLPLNDFIAQLQKVGDEGQPIAMIFVALSRNDDASVPDLTRRALAGMGQPLEISRMMDPLPGAPSGTPTMIKLAWARLHELADAGSAPAARMIADLQKRGLKE